MPPKPPRPVPPERILDYDEGDPYSCIAAGGAEEKLQKALERKVETCFGGPPGTLGRLAQDDLAGVLTALYDLWDRNREKRSTRSLALWAAQRMADLGEPAVLQYEQRS